MLVGWRGNPFQLTTAQTQVAADLVHGSGAGRISTLSVPRAQMQRPQGLENAQDVTEWALRLVPLPGTGNDQWTLTLAVTNGSKDVTGSGTAWYGGLQRGWGFVGPDGHAYEIDTVQSATALILKTNYQGATAAVQGYAAFPTMSLANDLVAQINTLISDYQTVKDGAGAGKFPFGTAAVPGMRFEGDEDTGLRRSASNKLSMVAGGADQLTLGSGPATGAAVQSSKTDKAVGKLMRADYGYSPGNFLGTASLGDLVERGKNANGSYFRFAGGCKFALYPCQ